MSHRIFISILNYNSNQETIDCLSSLQKVDLKDLKITTFVLDNASVVPLEVDIEKYKDINLEVSRSDDNLGFSGGHNIGVQKALKENCDFVLILNNDVLLDKKFLQELIEGFNENVGVTVPKIYFAKGHEYHKDKYKESERGKVIWYAGGLMDWNNVIGHHKGVDKVDEGQFDKKEETEFATGTCMLISRAVIEKTGMFDERYFLYYEDNDWCMRIKRAGYKIMYTPKSLVWHKNAASGGGSGSALQDYYITRNRLLFGLNYAPARTKVALIRESFRLLAKGRKWQQIGVRDYFMKKFGKGSYRSS